MVVFDVGVSMNVGALSSKEEEKHPHTQYSIVSTILNTFNSVSFASH